MKGSLIPSPESQDVHLGKGTDGVRVFTGTLEDNSNLLDSLFVAFCVSQLQERYRSLDGKRSTDGRCRQIEWDRFHRFPGPTQSTKKIHLLSKGPRRTILSWSFDRLSWYLIVSILTWVSNKKRLEKRNDSSLTTTSLPFPWTSTTGIFSVGLGRGCEWLSSTTPCLHYFYIFTFLPWLVNHFSQLKHL